MKRRLLFVSILVAYCALLIKVMVFKDVPAIRVGPLILQFGGTHEGTANLIPFKTILFYLLGNNGFIIGSINLVGNIGLLVPIGFLVPFVYQNITWKKTILLAIASGLSIETMQVLLHVGIFDIDDVILNAFGVIIGYWLFTIIPIIKRSAKWKRLFIATSVLITAVIVFVFVSVYQKNKEPLRIPHGFENGPQPSDKVDGTTHGNDPCNGTGGTGQIISVANNGFTIRRRDGVIQIIKITDQTKIRNADGPVAATELKEGVRVTLIIESREEKDGSMIASMVLVCNATGSGTTK